MEAGKYFFRLFYSRKTEYMAENTFLIVGLGNPGSKYERTRHNAGFLVIDYVADQFGVKVGSSKMHGVFGTFRMPGKQIFLLKPQAYMNRSGECVAQFARYFNIISENILVIHDDLDLNSGRMKIVAGGGAGGHKGIRSIIQHLGTEAFARLKIGIGRPQGADTGAGIPVDRYVLSRFSVEQNQVFEENLDRAAEGVRLYIEQGVEAAMNRINTRAGNPSTPTPPFPAD
jgi:PTH1 family peptidyl-tRNA hydrolase